MADGLLGKLPPKQAVGGVVSPAPQGGGLLGKLPPKGVAPPAIGTISTLGDTDDAIDAFRREQAQKEFDMGHKNPYLGPVSLGPSVEESQKILARQQELEPLIKQIEEGGGVPKQALWAMGHIDASQAGLANAADIGLSLAEGPDSIYKALGQTARTVAGSLPFVPEREPSQRAKDIAEATQIAAWRQAEKNFGDKLSLGAGNMTGVMGQLAMYRNIGVGGSNVINKLRGIEKVAEASKAAKLAGSAAQFGAYSAMPAIEDLRLGDAAVDFAKGAAVGTALGGATKFAETLPGKLTPWIARPAAQTAVLTAQQALETGELPNKSTLGADFIINAATQGVPQKLVPEFMRRSPAKPAETKHFDTLVNPDAEFAKTNKYGASGAADPAVGAVLSPESADAPTPVDNASIKTDYARTKAKASSAQDVLMPSPGDAVADNASVNTNYARTPNQYKPTNLAVDPSIGAPLDPAYKAAVDGNKPVYLDPNPDVHALTATEKAQREAGFNAPGMETAELKSGTAHYNPQALAKWLADPKNRGYRPLIAVEGGKVDFAKTLQNFEAVDRLGAPLGYGDGNASKEGATHTVTGRDANGKEIATILAKNPKAAEESLKKQGAETVEVKPLEQGVVDVVTERTAGEQPLNTTKPTGGKSNSREAGFSDLMSMVFGKGKNKEELHPLMEETAERPKPSKNWLYPQFDKVAAEADNVYTAGARAFSSHPANIRRASEFADDLWQSVGNDPRSVDLWSRFVIHQNAQALKDSGGTPEDHLFMPQDEWLLVKRNLDKFAGAKQVTEKLSAEMESLAHDAGIPDTARRYVQDAPYFRLPSLQTPAQRVEARDRAKRAGLPAFKGVKGYLASADLRAGAESSPHANSPIGRFFRWRDVKSGSAKRATGQSEAYATEPFTMAMEMLRAHTVPANHARFKNSVLDSTVTKEEATKLGGKVEFHGEVVPLERIIIGERPTWMEPAKPEQVKPDEFVERFAPKPIADMWNSYITSSEKDVASIVTDLLNLPTSIALATTGMDSGAYAAFGAASGARIPGYGRSVVEKATVKFGGVLKALGALRATEEVGTPEWKQMEKLLAETGSLRVSESGPQSPENSWRKPEFWVSKVAPPMHKLTTAVFSRGGMADRHRISYGLALKKVHPHLTDAQIVQSVQNLGGAFVKALQPSLVQAFNNPIGRIVAPFANFGTTKVRNAYETLTGKEPTAQVDNTKPRRTLRQFSQVPLSLGSLALLSYWLGDDKTLQEAVSHLGSFRKGGKDYPVTILDPLTAMVTSTFGIGDAIKGVASGASANQIVGDVLRAPVNKALGYLGPVTSAAWTLAFNGAPYVLPSGRLLPASPKTENPTRDRVAGAAKRLFSGFENQIQATTGVEPMSTGERIRETLLGMANMEGRPARSLESSRARTAYEEENLYDDTAFGIALEAKSKTGKDRYDFIADMASKRLGSYPQAKVISDVLKKINSLDKRERRGENKYQRENP